MGGFKYSVVESPQPLIGLSNGALVDFLSSFRNTHILSSQGQINLTSKADILQTNCQTLGIANCKEKLTKLLCYEPINLRKQYKEILGDKLFRSLNVFLS